MRYAWILLFLLLSQFTHAHVFFSEVFPDPILDESLNEWVEIVNNNSFEVDVKDWVFGDDKDNDTLEGGLYEGGGTIIPPFGTALITDDSTRVYNNFDVPSSTIKLYVNDASLGNGLGNSGETFYLYNREEIVDTVTYPKVREGMSAALIEGLWVETAPSPGLFEDITPKIPSACDYELLIEMNGSSFAQDDFEWRMKAINKKGGKANITGRALIVDSFGNEVKSYKPWTNDSITTKKTSTKYSPNLKAGSYILFANISVGCEDENLQNNEAFSFFTIHGEKKEREQASELSILNILDLGSDKEASFGQVIRVRIEVYKGDTGKTSVSVWAEHKGERVTKQSKFSVEEKFIKTTYTVPLFLPPNCKGKLKDGTYDVVVEGLGEEEDEKLKISGITHSLCLSTNKNPSPSRKKMDFEIIELPDYQNKISKLATIRVHNREDKTKKVDVWSYIYRGSKSYSGEREKNKKQIRLQPRSVSDITLANTPDVKQGGDYKIKFLFQQENRKTPDELTREIFIEHSKQQDQVLAVTTPKTVDLNREESLAVAHPLTMPKVVYESSAMGARKAVPLFFLFIIILLAVLMVWYAD